MVCKVLLTTGDLGTDNEWIVKHAINTPQGLAACRRKAELMAARTKRPVTAYTWRGGRELFRVG